MTDPGDLAQRFEHEGVELEAATHRNRVDNERLHTAMRESFFKRLDNAGVGDIYRRVIKRRMQQEAEELAAGMGAELAMGKTN